MSLRSSAVAILLAILPSAGTCAEADRVETAEIVEAVFRSGPIKSFMLQRDGELLADVHRKGMRADRSTNVKRMSKSEKESLIAGNLALQADAATFQASGRSSG